MFRGCKMSILTAVSSSFVQEKVVRGLETASSNIDKARLFKPEDPDLRAASELVNACVDTINSTLQGLSKEETNSNSFGL